MNRIYYLVTSVALLSLSAINDVDAQRTCDSDSHMQELLSDPEYQQAYEERQSRFNNVALSSNRSALCSNPVTLPIAIHYQGVSSPDQACLVALAQDQVQILNDDYQGTNADISNWVNQAASFFPGTSNGETCVEFCLATSNHPNGYGLSEGQPAVTINTTSGDFDSNWAGYVNVYVRNISALGYSPLGGSGNGDGVVVDNNAFGSGSGCAGLSPGSPYDLGRTLTHEMGHYLNLGHVWGGGCGSDDGVGDTPNSQQPYYGCPSNGSSSCSTTDMHMSYMDYTNDACMYMFSAGQSTRMENYVAANFGSLVNNTSVVCGPGQPAHCSNGIQDADETGVDCGGQDCAACPEPCLANELQLRFTFDNYPEDISFNILDESGAIVESGGNYANEPDGSTLILDFCLDNGCYTLNILDSYGDGLCCQYGNGSYDLTDAAGNSLASGATFTSGESTDFCVGDENDPCELYENAPVDLTKSFNPVNGVQDRVQLKWFKESPQVRYSDEDAAMCDIQAWPVRTLDPVTGAVTGVINDGDTISLVDRKKTYGNGDPREIFKWPLFFRADGANNTKRVEPNTRYRFRVRCECGFSGDGLESPWSAEKTFNTPNFNTNTGSMISEEISSKDKSSSDFNLADIQLRPNPASDYLEISLRDIDLESVEWSVIDMTGRTVTKGRFGVSKSEILRLEIGQLAEGTYHLMLVGTQYMAIERFMVKR